MDYIIVYEKRTKGNPIVGIHSQRFETEQIELSDIHPGDDPRKYGFLIVSEDIVQNMIAVKYKTDRQGRIVQEPVLREVTRDIATIQDTSLNTNIVVLGETIENLVEVKDLKNKKVRAKVINAEKGVIDVGEASGLMTVLCMIQTGETQPVIESQEVNWKWLKDKEGNITGMELIRKPEIDSGQKEPSPELDR